MLFVSPSSSDRPLYCAGQRLAPHYRTLGDLEWEVESTTVQWPIQGGAGPPLGKPNNVKGPH